MEKFKTLKLSCVFHYLCIPNYLGKRGVIKIACHGNFSCHLPRLFWGHNTLHANY